MNRPAHPAEIILSMPPPQEEQGQPEMRKRIISAEDDQPDAPVATRTARFPDGARIRTGSPESPDTGKTLPPQPPPPQAEKELSYPDWIER